MKGNLKNGCKNCMFNRPRNLKDKSCQKGRLTLFGFNCVDYEPDYEIGYQITIYDILNEERSNSNERR